MGGEVGDRPPHNFCFCHFKISSCVSIVGRLPVLAASRRPTLFVCSNKYIQKKKEKTMLVYGVSPSDDRKHTVRETGMVIVPPPEIFVAIINHPAFQVEEPWPPLGPPISPNLGRSSKSISEKKINDQLMGLCAQNQCRGQGVEGVDRPSPKLLRFLNVKQPLWTLITRRTRDRSKKTEARSSPKCENSNTEFDFCRIMSSEPTPMPYLD